MSTRNTFRADTTLRFSIIVPTHNEEEDIGATLRALCALDHPDFDVLVVDDSSDHTPEIVQACADRRVRYIRQTRGEGRSAARNQGILAASGEIVVILNADVHLPADFLRRLEGHYRSGADYVLVESRVSNTEALFPRYIQAQHEFYYGPDTLVNMNWTEGFSCRRKAAFAVGLFPEGVSAPLLAGEDGWFGERLEAHGCNRVFDRSIIVSHIMPSGVSEFFRQRIGRGHGTAQIGIQREGISPRTLGFRAIKQLMHLLVSIIVVVPIGMYAWRFSLYSSHHRADWMPFIWAVALERCANVVGIWQGFWEALRHNRNVSRGAQN